MVYGPPSGQQQQIYPDQKQVHERVRGCFRPDEPRIFLDSIRQCAGSRKSTKVRHHSLRLLR